MNVQRSNLGGAVHGRSKGTRQVLGVLSSNTLANRQKSIGILKPQSSKPFTVHQDSRPSAVVKEQPPQPFQIYCDDEHKLRDQNAENIPPPPIKHNRRSSGPSTTNAVQPFSVSEGLSQPRVPLRDLPVAADVSIESQDNSDEESVQMEVENESSPTLASSSIVEEEQEDGLTDEQREELIYALDMEEYQEECYEYMVEAQERFLPKWNYMTKQPDINFHMRSILVDWLVEVGEEYKLKNETIYLAVNYVDRFLSFMSVQRGKLQLVGTACMQIAAKYEEIYPPDVGEFVYITDDTYNKKQVLRMENLVLKVINFDLAVPTPLQFLTLYSKVAGSDEETCCLAQYLCELSLLDAETFLLFPSHVIAASSVALARHTLGSAAWPEAVRLMSKLCVDDFKNCLFNLHAAFTNASNISQQAIQDKYKQRKWCAVSNVKPVSIF